ncbi:ATP-binding cassette subfamily B multidrug efflux pump [Lachnospiraceae bacterium PF1-22]|uniref:ABC transporter ATP-binding protein n=1 Tax=Ohessyouella blattaphilus TaxID=2949333 RepID=UPI003E2060DC
MKIKRVMKLLKPYRFRFFLMLLFAVISVVATLLTPILIGEGVDQLVGPGAVKFARLRQIMIVIAVVVLISALAQWLMSLTINYITYNVVRNMRSQAFAHLQKLPLGYVDDHPAGDIISRLTTDIDQFSDGMLMGFTQFFTGILTIIGTILFMLSIHPQITLVVLVLTPLSFFVAGFIARRTYSLFKQQAEARGEMTGMVQEMVGNQGLVKVFNREVELEERFGEINERLNTTSVRATFFSSLVNPSTRFINGLVSTGVCIYGAFVCLSGGITIGALASFMNYAYQYTKPFNEISGVITELQNALACGGRVFDFLETEIITEGPELKKMDAVRGAVAFKEVAFSYDKAKPFIEHMNINTKPGERVALVGPTGCGKSTLINLLMRFYEIDSGAITVDETDIRTYTRGSLREHFGMVLQETWLKKGTVAENIAYGKPSATLAEIQEAAKSAHAHNFIMRLEKGYDTVISENGGNLSAGQKQLLCIARVFLVRPPMLILDEATSSIDTRTELMVQDALKLLMTGRSSFVVAHRLSTIKEADKILVMRDGKIIESGKHEELLAKNGFYAQLYASQFAQS